ncbi:beta-glucan synthesis-associated protein [Basidiobolus ranarum]|uniref:Beta-glucan synthesis-associated protein n=1 Tax=Basidiobolus ranarum TaxID=34480 RepID=A0ABR2WMN0_9FUNG
MGFFQTHRSIKLWAIVITVVGLICLVVITPIVRHEKNKNHHRDDYNADVKASPQGKSGTTSSGPTSTVTSTATPVSSWIDPDTPKEFTTKMAGGQNFTLVFSDEFEKAGRTFAEGDDPKWTAVNLHYWSTGDYEWYSPDAVSTSDGSMKITMSKHEINGQSYMSGMVQSWNKFCFTGGIIEVNVSLPGSSDVPGFWPAIWTLGNLGRAGYGATTDGTWPYTYDTCDAAVAANQSMPRGFSNQPGQKLNKCVCPGEDHPNPGVGRGAPEIDIFEVSVNSKKVGIASLSDQVAPFNVGDVADGKYMHFYDPKAWRNGWPGGPLQQCVSGN